MHDLRCKLREIFSNFLSRVFRSNPKPFPFQNSIFLAFNPVQCCIVALLYNKKAVSCSFLNVATALIFVVDVLIKTERNLLFMFGA